MSNRNYWLSLYTGTTWQEFSDAGARVAGFPDSRWSTVKKIRQEDYLLCYLTGVSRLIAVLKVNTDPFQDQTPIWKESSFSSRIGVDVLVSLTPETAVPILELKDQLKIFQNLKKPNAWGAIFRTAPTQWSSHDGELVVKILSEAKANPIVRPVNQAKLNRKFNSN